LQVSSGENSLRDAAGVQLDGDANNSPGGDYVDTFTIAPTNARRLGIQDFARGPSQPVELGGTSGIPVRIDNAEGVERVQFEVHYDPSLLTVNDVRLSDELPAGWFLAPVVMNRPGKLDVLAFGTRPLVAGPLSLVVIEAEVPAAASNGAAHVLTIDDTIINDGAIAARSDEAVHAVAYLGDATGNNQYSALDASLIARTAVDLDTGFDNYSQIDPVVIGDVSGNGGLSGFDAALIARKALGLDEPGVPDLPTFVAPAPLAFSNEISTASSTRSISTDILVTVPLAFKEVPQNEVRNENGNRSKRSVDSKPSIVSPTRLPAWSVNRGESPGTNDTAGRSLRTNAGEASPAEIARDALFSRIGRSL
jgi:hypothetical protein